MAGRAFPPPSPIRRSISPREAVTSIAPEIASPDFHHLRDSTMTISTRDWANGS
jgi:hypothetical protein